jgi:FkbM family methyltransferase
MGIGAGSSVEFSVEKIILRLLREIYFEIHRKLCVFDVGSNKGQFLSFIISGLGNIPVVIHSFEPSLYTSNALVENNLKNENINLNNFGLGKKAGDDILYYDSDGSGLASLTKRRLSHIGIDFIYSESVRIDTVDNYCLTNGIEKTDFMKLDVEGHELDVLAGGEGLIKQNRIKMISFEFGGCNIDTKTYFQDFLYYFNAVGMTIYRITPSGNLVRIEKYKEIHEQFRATNYIVSQSPVLLERTR